MLCASLKLPQFFWLSFLLSSIYCSSKFPQHNLCSFLSHFSSWIYFMAAHESQPHILYSSLIPSIPNRFLNVIVKLFNNYFLSLNTFQAPGQDTTKDSRDKATTCTHTVLSHPCLHTRTHTHTHTHTHTYTQAFPHS